MTLLADAEKRNPNYVHVFHERAMIHAGKNEWSEAIEAFKKAIALSPLNAVRYKDAADVLFKVKRYREAIDLLELAVKHQLSFPDLYHYLSQATFALKDFKQASKYVRTALSADPENCAYLNQLGICLKEIGELDEAVKAYNQVIKNDPTNVDALYNKAILLYGKGDKEEAVKLLERALRKKPDFPEATRKLDEIRRALATPAA
jgi:tetratricopeptide (TPR) repeat protein